MKKTLLVVAASFMFLGLACAQEKNLLIDDFEDVCIGVGNGTVDAGAGNGSSVEVGPALDIIRSGKQALKVSYDAVSGGYIYVARGYDLDVKASKWLVDPKDIKWDDYKAISFYMYGSDSKAKISFDIKDSGNEIWRFIAEDNFKGWKQIVCPFDQFTARNDWQPESADKNSVIDFPLKSYQFEPLPEAKGVLYFEDVELIRK
ncbi:MAG: hypothetical protein KJ880_06495 [Candidatus Omnitrophica bacterium]|nr:hypothetical protein [Candidatus Omnitrophota bacterium]MBU1869089.1 hypothetical protein [Candidatus Omnitrophota bacterium]